MLDEARNEPSIKQVAVTEPKSNNSSKIVKTNNLYRENARSTQKSEQ